MKALIIEDDDEKLRNLCAFLENHFTFLEILTARSIASGLRAAISGRETLSFMLLDMSMPSYDITTEEPAGGNPEPYAGRELLAQMKLRGLYTPVLVVTMFDSFGKEHSKMSLSQLTEDLARKFSPPFCGVVHYDARQEGWQSSLKQKIEKILYEN